MTSLANRAFHASPPSVQSLALSLYGAKLRRTRYGGVHRETLTHLLESQLSSTDQFESLAEDAFGSLVTFARRTVPMYRESMGKLPSNLSLKDLPLLPIVRKADLLRAGMARVSTDFKTSDLVHIHTGGTTGEPLSVFSTKSAIQTNYAFYERLRHWAGVPDGCRMATFAGRAFLKANASAPFSRLNWPARARLFSSYHLSATNAQSYLDELADWNPELIDSYPSSLAPLANFVLERGDDRVRPRAVITSSETLGHTVREDISAAFRTKVFDQYGAAEMAAFISQCESGSYHVNPEFGVVELLVDGGAARPGEVGEIVATGFLNHAMPMIRYATGDWGVWSDTLCPCGRAMPVMKEIGGRVDDVIETPDGRWIGRLDPVFKVASSAFESQIVQDASDHIRVEIAAQSELKSGDIEAIREQLVLRLGSEMKIDFLFVPSIARTRSGKLRSVVNEWRRERLAGSVQSSKG